MIIEFDLQGSISVHRGIFETTGFWVRFEEESETINDKKYVSGYKLYNNGSFSFYHTDKKTVDRVALALRAILGKKSLNENIKDVGYISFYLNSVVL